MEIMQESQNLRRVIFKHFIFSKEIKPLLFKGAVWPINEHPGTYTSLVRLTVNFHQERGKCKL